jgi:hypothetical protein
MSGAGKLCAMACYLGPMLPTRNSQIGRGLLLAGAGLILAAVDGPGGGDFRVYLREYTEILLEGEAGRARSKWWPADLRHAERLGTRYGGLGAKIDGASVLVLAADPLRRQGTLLDTVLLDPEGPYERLELSVRGNSANPVTTYYGQWDGERWWLRHPILLAVEGWPGHESRYLRMKRHPERPFHALAFGQLDRFVERAAEALEMPAGTLDTLRREKIDWFLGPESVVHTLSGAPAHGVLTSWLTFS